MKTFRIEDGFGVWFEFEVIGHDQIRVTSVSGRTEIWTSEQAKRLADKLAFAADIADDLAALPVTDG